MRRLTVAVTILATGCGNNTTGPGEQGTPLDVLTSLEEAYCSRDTGAFEGILQEGFFHSIPESSWGDYNGDGILDTGWDAELQVDMIDVFFEECTEICLSIDEQNALIHYFSPGEALLSFDFNLDYTGTGPGYINTNGSWNLLVSYEPGGDWKLLEASDADGWVGFLP